MNDFIAIGNIRTSHGVKGLLKVRSYSGETDHFFELEEVTLKDRRGREKRFDVERCLLNGKELLMKLKGIDSREAGKFYANWEVWVPREKAAPLDEGEFYYADLLGSRLYHGDVTLGRVVNVCDGGGGTLIQVERPEGEKFFVPFRKEFIGEVDIESGAIELLEIWVAEG